MWPIYVKTRGACRLVENVMCIFVEYALIDLIVYNPFKERTKFYWPWAEESVLIVQTGSRPFKKLNYDVKTMIIKQSPQNFIEGDK
jgi:hypothetical protein